MILFEPHIATDLILKFNQFTRIYWVIGFVFIWYTYKFLTDLLKQFDLKIVINVAYDPCWLDFDNVYILYQYAYDLCNNITDYGNMVSYTSKQINYYEQIDESYIFDKKVYNSSSVIEAKYNVYYNWSCDYRALVGDINPVQSSFSFYNLFVDTGFLTAIMIEPIIAEFIKSVFTLIHPLCCSRGNVLVPDEFYLDDENEEALLASEKSLMDNLSGYIRFNAFIKAMVYITILIFLFINIADFSTV